MSRELSKEIRTKAAPFVEWLQNAEEDSDEEEEENESDDGVEVSQLLAFQIVFIKTEIYAVYFASCILCEFLLSLYRLYTLFVILLQFTNHPTGTKPVAAPLSAAAAVSNGTGATQNDDEEDDLDIDDI